MGNKENIDIFDIREDVKDSEIIEGFKTIKLSEILLDISILNNNRKIILLCTIGLKSKEAIKKIKKAGYMGEIYSLKGGITSFINDL